MKSETDGIKSQNIGEEIESNSLESGLFLSREQRSWFKNWIDFENDLFVCREELGLSDPDFSALSLLYSQCIEFKCKLRRWSSRNGKGRERSLLDWFKEKPRKGENRFLNKLNESSFPLDVCLYFKTEFDADSQTWSENTWTWWANMCTVIYIISGLVIESMDSFIFRVWEILYSNLKRFHSKIE